MEPLGLAIDFGSTRTKVAYFDSSKNEPQLIELGQEIRAIIPSVFYIPKEGNPSVGDDALMMVDHDPEGIVIGLKKEIHRSGMVRCGPGRPPIERVVLASEIFSHIRRFCQKEVFLEKNINLNICTLTVPVSFEEKQRDCIRKAAELAGFKHIILIEEPVAAARAWLSTAGKTLATDHVIICDAGGGTTDFGLLRYEKGRFESVPDVPTDGFPSGGNDIDESILDRVLETGTNDADSARNSRGAFLVKIRQAKELFARHPASEKPISLNGITLQVPLKAVKDSGHLYIEKTVDGLKRFLIKCSTVVKAHEIPILLVGGGSRLSGLKEAIEVLAPGRVFQWNHSDYATVLGAATPLLKPVGPTTPPKTPNLKGYREVVKLFSDNQNFTYKNLEDLTRMSAQLGLSKEEASPIETEVFGMPKELFYDLCQEQKLKEILSRYRKEVKAKNFLGKHNFTIKDLEDLTRISAELGLSEEQASQIETEIIGMPKGKKLKEILSRYRDEVKAKNFLGKHNFTIKDLEDLTRISAELGLSEEQASQIETEVLGMPKKPFYDSHPTPPVKPQEDVVQKAGEVITNELGMKFAWIPSGTFVMGSPESEADRSSNETSHKVTITKGFYLGIYTVTQEQWEAVMGTGFLWFGGNPSTTKGDKLPVTDVSWEDCQEFIKKLNAKTGDGYRLPTESEWEYGCRAGTATAYYFGAKITPKDANYADSNIRKQVAVGSYKPNAFGLYDMHGNVWEWCEDWYRDFPTGAVTDPKGPQTGQARVLRGGAFSSTTSGARSSCRFNFSPTYRYIDLGLRLAWTK